MHAGTPDEEWREDCAPRRVLELFATKWTSMVLHTLHAGAVIAVPEGRRIRPKALLLAWMAAAAHEDGPLFRKLTPTDRLTDRPMSDRSVARIVQKHTAAAG